MFKHDHMYVFQGNPDTIKEVQTPHDEIEESLTHNDGQIIPTNEEMPKLEDEDSTT